MSSPGRRILPLLLALCLCLSGCGALLERSYSFSEPYVNRYWDTAAGDTLRAGNYQDLVNSLLMLVEQRSEEGVVRYSARTRSYNEIYDAVAEVRQKTTLGSYLLESMLFRYEDGEDDCTITLQITYREDTEDVSGLMLLSDSQSLVDLLRLALREEHQRQTAQFVYETVRREDVLTAVEELWAEICLEQSGEGDASEVLSPEELPVPPEGGEPPSQTETGQEEPPPAGGEGEPEESEEGEEPGEPAEPASGEVEIPPCPWEIRFYPDTEYAGIVEIWLNTAASLDNSPGAGYNRGQATP